MSQQFTELRATAAIEELARRGIQFPEGKGPHNVHYRGNDGPDDCCDFLKRVDGKQHVLPCNCTPVMYLFVDGKIFEVDKNGDPFEIQEDELKVIIPMEAR